MLVDNMDYVYEDMELSFDGLEPYIYPNDEISPWDKFSVDGTYDTFGGSSFEGNNSNCPESKCCLSTDLMWGSGSVDPIGGSGDLEEVTKIFKKIASEKPPMTPKPSPPPPAVTNNPPNQRSLLIKSQPQYQALSSASITPPISDDESAPPLCEEQKTDTLKDLEEHLTSCSALTSYLENDIILEDLTPFYSPLDLSTRLLSPPPRPSFAIDHCYSKEVEPEDDGPYESNLGVDTPSETDDEDELFERADASFIFKQENLQDDDDDEEEEEEQEQKESITRMIKTEIDDEEEEIDVVSVSDHPHDIKLSPSTSSNSSSYLYPKTKRNVYGSFGTIPKKTLPIPERKCVNGKYILLDMEDPTPVKRNVGRTATKPVPKKRRSSSSDDEEDDDDDDDSDSESSYKRSYSRYGSRKHRSPPKKRRVSVEMESGSDKRSLHNSLERMRRIGLKNLFDNLRNAIPSISQRDRTAKVVILNTATAMVGQVQRQEDKYTAEKVALKRKQEMLRKRLSELRKLAARNR